MRLTEPATNVVPYLHTNISSNMKKTKKLYHVFQEVLNTCRTLKKQGKKYKLDLHNQCLLL